MDKKLKDENLKIAIQKDGRLTNESIKTLRSMGIEFEIYNRKLFAISRDFPIEILLIFLVMLSLEWRMLGLLGKI